MTEDTPAVPNKGGRRRGVWQFTTPDALVRWRTEHDISRAEVARQLGVAFSAVERWENGAAVALPELQQRIAKLINSAAPLEDEDEKADDVAPRPAATSTAHGDRDSAVLGTSAIVTEYIRHSKLKPEALVKLTRDLREALR
jgi:transcriptional regulator with XRE-family HTH domain